MYEHDSGDLKVPYKHDGTRDGLTENAGHEIARHENAIHEFAIHDK